MASSNEQILGVVTGQVTIPPGNTNAVYLSAVPSQGALLLKYLSGGTLEIHGANVTNGSTMPGASLPALGTGYIVSTSEVVSFAGPVRMYLMATGATVVTCFIKGLTPPGFNNPNDPAAL